VSEMQKIEAALPLNLEALDSLKSEVGAPWRSLDVDAVYHVRDTTLRQQEQSRQHFSLTISLCVVVLCLIVYFVLCIQLHQCMLRCFGNNASPNLETEPPSPHANLIETGRADTTDQWDANQASISYTAYSTQQSG
jgi:hypothetical protein